MLRPFAANSPKIEAAQCAALCEAARTASYAIVTKRAAGEKIGAERSSAIFASVMAERRVAEFVVEYLPDALEALARPFADVPIGDHSFALTSVQLDRELADGGFLNVAFDPEPGVGTAAVIVERLARLPFATEAAPIGIVRPLLGERVSGPICMAGASKRQPLVQFLREGATVVVGGDDSAATFTATAAQVSAEP